MGLNATATTAIALDKLQATLSRVVTAMLGVGLDDQTSNAGTNLFPPPDFSRPLLTSAVEFFGAWRGSCLVCCEAEVARELTERFLGMPLDSNEEIGDCMGEVANIVGGNVKALLPRGVDHSMPTFQTAARPTGETLVAVVFKCTAGPLWVSLIHSPV